MMDSDDLAKGLHDQATRGVDLSADEQAQLDAWYARQDAEESRMFAPAGSPPTIAALQAQVDAAVAQFLTAAQRVRDLTRQNEALRLDIAALQRQLPQGTASRTA